MGSFNDYEWIRGALVWLGCNDPTDTREAIFEADPRKDELITVMDAWETHVGVDTGVELGDIPKKEMYRELERLLADVACRGMFSAKSVGWWLRRHKERVVGGRCFRAQASRNGLVWWLAKVETQADALEGEAP